MAQPSFPIYPTPSFPNPELCIRSRREIDTKDAINARQFEHWQTDGKSDIYNRPDLNSQAPFNDVLPLNSRVNTNNYRSMPRFNEQGHKGGNNPYFDKYDTSYDARNMIRELRATVYEDKITGYISESNHLLERNFDNRWFNTSELKNVVETAESLRFKMDDISVVYKNKIEK